MPFPAYAQNAAPAVAKLPAAAPSIASQAISVKPGDYVIEPRHTQVEFAAMHLGLTEFFGRFSDVSGQLALNTKDPASSVVSISLPADTVSTTNPKLNDELRGPKWFDAAHHPTITFQSSRVVPTGPADADVTGDLTLRGVSHPVTLHAHFNAAGTNPIDKRYGVGFRVSGTIHRSDFGMDSLQPIVADAVMLTISGAFERQQ